MSGKSKHQRWREAIGAKVTKLTPEVIKKLKEAFTVGATLEQACYYAEIVPNTYRNWCKKFPELLREFDEMKQRMPLRAKQNIALAVEKGDIGLSKWLVERKEPADYGEKLKIEHGGQIQSGDSVHPEDEVLRVEYKQKLLENIRKRWADKNKNQDETPNN